jgi:hypothetical protein
VKEKYFLIIPQRLTKKREQNINLSLRIAIKTEKTQF